MRIRSLLLAFFGVTMLTGCVSAPPAESSPSPDPSPTEDDRRSEIPTAYNTCKSDTGWDSSEDWFSIPFIDDGAGIELYSDVFPVFMIECITSELGMSQAEWSRVMSTRALDGMVDAQWEGYEASWTYHPDSGLRMVVSQVDND